MTAGIPRTWLGSSLALVLAASLGCDRSSGSGARPDRIPPLQPAPEPRPNDVKPEPPAGPSRAPSTSAAGDHHPPGYRLIYADEFEGRALDRRQWCTRYVYGGGPPLQLNDPACVQAGKGTLDFLNDEAQRYRDLDSRGQPLHEVRDGVLTLIATRGPGKPRYEAGMIRSKRLFKPDSGRSLYITARVRLPSVKGTWPAFWLNSDRDERGELKWPPEIDIFEAPLNGVEDRANMLKVGAVTRNRPKQMRHLHARFNARWRNYHAVDSLRDRWIETAVEWTHDSVCYFLDGVRLMCEDYRWIHDDGRPAPAAHILLNIAVGGNWAGRHGVDDAALPARFSIDYVRVYERPATAGAER